MITADFISCNESATTSKLSSTQFPRKLDEKQKAYDGGFRCQGCKIRIADQHLLQVVDCFWHEDCLRCSVCQVRLGEVGSSLYSKHNMLLCKRDYLRLFGSVGHCAACGKLIPSFELVMRVKDDFVYHLECFACQQCDYRFCVGDRFYLIEGKIECESDYKNRLAMCEFGSLINVMAYSTEDRNLHILDYNLRISEKPLSTTTAPSVIGHSTLRQARRQMDDSSSGYSSPSPTMLV